MADAAPATGADTLTSSAPAPSPAPTPAPSPAASPPAAAANDAAWDWAPHAKDEDLGWVQSKGYKTPADLLKAARNSEKLIGHDKVPLPKDETDTEGYARVWEKLGRPATPADYKIELPEGTDRTFVDRITKSLHANGASQKLAAELIQEYMAYGAEANQRAEAEQKSQWENDQRMLETEWGKAYDQQIEHARRGAREFGFDNATLGKIEGALGKAGLLRMMNKIGLGLTEDKRVGGEGSGGNALTPERAKYEIGQLRLDSKFMEAYMDRNHPGHDVAIKKMQTLQEYAAPE